MGRLCEVYPRGCGGTVGGRAWDRPAAGLSPRVRGNHTLSTTYHISHRSIPAGAGEPSSTSLTERTEGGLSPRVRGNRVCHYLPPFGLGSIPAGAGEPLRRARPDLQVEVYPRGCGGTSWFAHWKGQATGLSPRVRGNPCWPWWTPNSKGSIPAGAGEPFYIDIPAEPETVYPRGCGGTFIALSIQGSAPGLSPRVRGNPV